MPERLELKETALYVDDVERAMRFYRDVLGFSVLARDERFAAMDVAGRHVLLLFLRGGALLETSLPGGMIPAHDGAGPMHAGFAVAAADLREWESKLVEKGVEIISRMDWPRGGRSIYFRDPDGHLLELLTPGVWATY